MYFPDLLEQYKQLLKQMKSEGVTSGDLYREVKQAVEWMETGYDPAEVRASTRVDASTADPYTMQTYFAYVNNDEMLMPEHLQRVKKEIVNRWIPEETDSIRVDEYIRIYFNDFSRAISKAGDAKEKIRGALKGLSDNEKAAFIAVEVEKMPYTKVAKMFGVEKTTIQCYLQRARQKIRINLKKGTQDSLDLFGDIA